MRLSGWHRLGVVVSALWLFSSYNVAVRVQKDALQHEWYLATTSDCENNEPGKGKDICVKHYMNMASSRHADDGQKAVYIAVLPILFGWIMGYVIAWVVAGFRADRRLSAPVSASANSAAS